MAENGLADSFGKKVSDGDQGEKQQKKDSNFAAAEPENPCSCRQSVKFCEKLGKQGIFCRMWT